MRDHRANSCNIRARKLSRNRSICCGRAVSWAAWL